MPAPFAGRFIKWKFNLSTWTTTSRWSPYCKMYFRSQNAIYKEKRRQAMNPAYRFIVHPFSRFCMIRQMLMSVIYLVVLYLDPFLGAFKSNYLDKNDNAIAKHIQFGLNILLGIDIIVSFFVGYSIERTKEIVLEPRRIARNYLKSYFIFDLVPVVYSVAVYILYIMAPIRTYTYATIPHLYFLRLVRMKTMNDYLGYVLVFFGVHESFIRCITISLFTLFLIHWWTCLFFVISCINFFLSETVSDSWVITLSYKTNRDMMNLYIEVLLAVICHFFGAGKGSIRTSNPTEQLILALMIMCGVTCHIYVIAVILQLFGTINVSESKYEELIYQLNEYMVTKKLPQKLRKRLIVYYEYRFQKQFFLEDVILSSLSEHLRYEVLLYSCRNLIDKVRIFQGASKTVIGTVISMLKHEIFLPNDRIIKPDTPNDCVFFISFGTVAVFLPNGKEVVHLEDGHHFGEVHIALQNAGEKRFTTVTAIEITEVFYLNRKDFLYCINTHPEVAQRLENVALNRLTLYKSLMEMSQEVMDTVDIMTELRKGRILEHGRKR